MLSPEQKSLCIKLYTEDEISIKEILSKTGIRSEQTVYRILKEAGKNLKAYRMKKYFESLCRVYKGELKNPIDKREDEFKWYIWKHEEVIIRISQDPHFIEKYHLDKECNWEEFFRNEIDATIEMYADTPYGGDPRKWYKRYYEL